MTEPLARALSAHGYTTPTPIQAQAVPPQIAGRDLLALAETGSGKTAAFVLPLLNSLATKRIDPAPRKVLSLILAPTRELALQIDAEVAALSRFMNIRRAVVLGGVSKGPQINALKRGVHVLVATPGRLLDHVNCRNADLSEVSTLILDEADRMFDMGFIRDIRKIVSLVPKDRRTALLSATMPNEIRSLAHDLLKDPFRIDLSPKTMVVDRIDQKVMMVRTPEKQSRLHTILADEACKRVIVFTRTKRGADRVTSRLEMAGIGAEAIHGNKAQNARQRALAGFSAGHVRVLVATDIAARGIDVSDVTHVINFEMPVEAETYIHRIGRTARKGKGGIAISLCDPSEQNEIRAIERLIKSKIEIIGDVGGAQLPAFKSERPERDPRAKPSGERGGHRGQGARAGERRRAQGDRMEGLRSREERRAAPRGEEQRNPQAGEHKPRAEHRRPEGSIAGPALHGVKRMPSHRSAERPHRSDEPRAAHGEGERRHAARPPRAERPEGARDGQHNGDRRPRHQHESRTRDGAATDSGHRPPRRPEGNRDGHAPARPHGAPAGERHAGAQHRGDKPAGGRPHGGGHRSHEPRPHGAGQGGGRRDGNAAPRHAGNR